MTDDSSPPDGLRPSTSPSRGEAKKDDGRLAENILYFARALRAAGIPLGPGSVLDALAAVRAAGVGTKEDFYWTLHAVFVKRHEHSVLFDQAFKIFFRKRGYLERLIAMMSPEMTGAPAQQPEEPQASQRVLDALFQGGEKIEREKQEIELDTRLTVSDREVLEKKDFAQMTAAEIAAAKDAIKRMVLGFDDVKTRRLTPHLHGHSDRSAPHAALEPQSRRCCDRFEIPRAARPRTPPVVALLDISGSMSQYTRLFLHFLHAITDARKRVPTFLFGTRLTNVSRALRERDPDEALAACSAGVLDWSGGTRIATSLAVFNKQWSRRVLTQGAVVLLFTDGLERDPDERLGFEIDRLHRSCRRLIWLNPLLRFSGFEAKARGIKVMLPHVDELRPIHNLESMKRPLSGAFAAPAAARPTPRHG